MMYLNGKQGFLEDFFTRTREIIQDYEKSTNHKYETTLLCNCLLGILVFRSRNYSMLSVKLHCLMKITKN